MYFDDELRVWINHSAEGSTLQLRVSASHDIHELPPLPIVTAGAVRCGQEFVVTGADSKGRPIVVGSDADGGLVWQHRLDVPQPARWPVPGCIPQPVIIWQTDDGQVEVADVRPSGVVRPGVCSQQAALRSISQQPATLHGRSGVMNQECGDLEAGGSGIRKSQIAPGYASQLSVGPCNGGVCVAWGREQSFLTRRASANAAFDAPVRLDDAGH